MSTLQNKIDFEGIIVVENANCNGDPLNGNMPRVTYKGYGEMSDVCIKRKIQIHTICLQIGCNGSHTGQSSPRDIQLVIFDGMKDAKRSIRTVL